MPLDVYLAYLATVAVFFASPPGPSQLLMMTNSLQYGVKSSLNTAAGDLTANALQMIAAGFGLATLIAAFPESLIGIKWAGVAYLVWIGIRMFRASPSELPESERVAGRRGQLFRQGFITSATNPTAIFFFAALFPQFIDPELAIWPQLFILGATYIVIDGSLLTLWGSAARSLVARLRGNRSGRLNRLSGGLIVAAAVLLAFKDVEAVLS